MIGSSYEIEAIKIYNCKRVITEVFNLIKISFYFKIILYFSRAGYQIFLLNFDPSLTLTITATSIMVGLHFGKFQVGWAVVVVQG